MLQNHIEETKKEMDDLEEEYSLYKKKAEAMRDLKINIFVVLALFYVFSFATVLYRIITLDDSAGDFNERLGNNVFDLALFLWFLFGWIIHIFLFQHIRRLSVKDIIPNNVRDSYEHDKKVLMDRFLELKKAKKLENTERYEDAARICKNLGLWDEAERIRKKIHKID